MAPTKKPKAGAAAGGRLVKKSSGTSSTPPMGGLHRFFAQAPKPVAVGAVPGEVAQLPEIAPNYAGRHQACGSTQEPPAAAVVQAMVCPSGPACTQDVPSHVSCNIEVADFSRIVNAEWLQYNALYAARLAQLRAAVMGQAQRLWAGEVPPERFRRDLAGCRAEGSGQEVILVGVVWKDMKVRPKVVEMHNNKSAAISLESAGPAAVPGSYCSDDDVLWLEDGGMRLRLLLPEGRGTCLVTGATSA